MQLLTWLRAHRSLLQTALLATLTVGLIAYQVRQAWQHRAADQAQARDVASDQARAERSRRADSAAAFTAGRLFEQRIAQKNLRHEDETHDSTRRPAGFIQLPAFPARRP